MNECLANRRSRWIFRTAAGLTLLAACTGGQERGEAGDVTLTGGIGDDDDDNGGEKLDLGGGGTGDNTTPLPCGSLPAIVRDFSVQHPDFEAFGGNVPLLGIVEPQLGDDRTPVLALVGPQGQNNGVDSFHQWYHDTPNVNHRFEIELALVDGARPGECTYSNAAYFPIDGQGFGNEGNNHNFHFTTEIHTRFFYRGGERFEFTGDDDVWVFVAGRLVVDLGGLHPEANGSVELDQVADELGLIEGSEYDLEIFHAERHTTASNFKLATTIGILPPE